MATAKSSFEQPSFVQLDFSVNNLFKHSGEKKVIENLSQTQSLQKDSQTPIFNRSMTTNSSVSQGSRTCLSNASWEGGPCQQRLNSDDTRLLSSHGQPQSQPTPFKKSQGLGDVSVDSTSDNLNYSEMSPIEFKTTVNNPEKTNYQKKLDQTSLNQMSPTKQSIVLPPTDINGCVIPVNQREFTSQRTLLQEQHQKPMNLSQNIMNFTKNCSLTQQSQNTEMFEDNKVIGTNIDPATIKPTKTEIEVNLNPKKRKHVIKTVNDSTRAKCRCKGNCLRNQCECFRKMRMCSTEDCGCGDTCKNKDAFNKEIMEARLKIMQREPDAFDKMNVQSVDKEGGGTNNFLKRGCNCRKNGCKQNQCICKKMNVFCGPNCGNCNNNECPNHPPNNSYVPNNFNQSPQCK